MSQPTGASMLLRSITPVQGQPLDVGTINVLVGPNNAGKTEALRDIARLVGKFEPTGLERASDEEPRTRIVQDVTFVPKLSLDRLLRGITVEGSSGEGTVIAGLGPDLKTPYRRSVAADVKSVLFRPIITARSVWMTALGEVMPLRVAYLSPHQRTRLIEPVAAASPIRAPENLLQAFQFAGAEIEEAFDSALAPLCDGRHIRLDATERVNLCLRIADNVPALTGQPIHDVYLYRALPRLDEQGDGWKSCASIILSFLLCPGRVILLEQPEAFLQPRQSWRLGAWIAENAARLGIQVFVATHDAAFINGLYAGRSDVSILRLARRENMTRIELISPEVGKTLAGFPLFAAQNAIRCLFEDGVVVAPEESDRIIYQSVAARLKPVPQVAFLHAHGSRNLAFVAKILKRATVPVCVIAELDVFQAEQVFTELVKSLSHEDPPAPWLATRERLVSHVEGWFDEREMSSSATEVENFLDQLKKGDAVIPALQPAHVGTANAQAKWNRLRRERLTVLPAELRVWTEELLEEMKRVGVFVSPQGRLQGWIRGPAAEDKEVWFNRAIQALDRGECPADLRAFVAEATAFIQKSANPPSAARTGHAT